MNRLSFQYKSYIFVLRYGNIKHEITCIAYVTKVTVSNGILTRGKHNVNISNDRYPHLYSLKRIIL